MKILKKIMDTTLIVVLILVITYVLCVKTNAFPSYLVHMFEFAPYVVIPVGLILAWKFNYSKIFFTLLLFAISFAALTFIEKPKQQEVIYLVVSILLPINILIICFFKERGIISSWGIIRLLFIFIQAYIVNDLIMTNSRDLIKVLKKDIIPMEYNISLPLSEIAMVIFLLTLTISLIRIVIYQSAMEASFFGSLLLLFYMLIQSKQSMPIIFTMIGILFIITIIKSTYFMAFYDELTRLPSRRALKQDMMKLGAKYTIAMLDIDFFKKFNDKYGHDTGDDVLKLVASIIKDVRGGGKSYRYGGEEFTMLFPGKAVETAFPYLEELRETIAKKGFCVTGKNAKSPRKVSITVSIGAAQKNETNKSTEDVLKAADRALYRAKKKGRNCVCK